MQLSQGLVSGYSQFALVVTTSDNIIYWHAKIYICNWEMKTASSRKYRGSPVRISVMDLEKFKPMVNECNGSYHCEVMEDFFDWIFCLGNYCAEKCKNEVKNLRFDQATK